MELPPSLSQVAISSTSRLQIEQSPGQRQPADPDAVMRVDRWRDLAIGETLRNKRRGWPVSGWRSKVGLANRHVGLEAEGRNAATDRRWAHSSSDIRGP